MQIRAIDAARIRETVRDLCMIATTELGEDVVGAVLRRCFVVVAIGSLVACGDSGGVTRPRVDQISSSEAPSPRPLIYTIEGTTVRSEPTFAQLRV